MSKYIYVSTDVETDGPIPGPNSMLSFGSVALDVSNLSDLRECEISSFSANLELLPDASPDPETQHFWSDNAEAYAMTRVDARPPREALGMYSAWLRSLPGTPVFVGYPATFDFMFVHWYLIKFTGSDPYGFQGLDMKSYASALLGNDFKKTKKESMPKRWFRHCQPHNHVAIDDAREQGLIFLSMYKESTARKKS